MRIAALSDFHIGVSRRRDGFLHDLDRFARFLDELEASHDVIVLLGDIFQTDHVALPSRARERRHLLTARRSLGSLGLRMLAPPYRYVFGNHDRVAADVLDAPESLRLDDDGVGVFFIHGHQFDPVARKAQLAADFGTWFTGRLRAVGLRPVAQWFEERDIVVKDRAFCGLDGPYVEAARRLAREHAASIVVMGHTHVASLTTVDECVVVNTGTCSRGRFAHVSVDTAARTVELVLEGRIERAALP